MSRMILCGGWEDSVFKIQTKPLKMTDTEEPPTKISKYEMSQTFTQDESLEDSQELVHDSIQELMNDESQELTNEEGQEVMNEESQEFAKDESQELAQDEGQEEWLSDGLLTDDDGHAENGPPDPDRTVSDLDAQDNLDETAEDIPPTEEMAPDTENKEASPEPKQEKESKPDDPTIEQTLNSLENTLPEVGDELSAFLVKKSDVKKVEESDGNDTDDLLRMLEDDDKTKKTKKVMHTKPKKVVKEEDHSTDDDEYIFEGSTVKKLTVAKNALIRSRLPARKAVPEDYSDEDDDESSDDPPARRFPTRHSRQTGKSVSKPVVQGKPAAKPVAKPVAKMVGKPVAKPVGKPVMLVGSANSPSPVKKPVSSTPRQNPRKANDKSLLKSNVQSAKSNLVKLINRPPITKKEPELDEIINEEEFLDEDEFDLDEDFAEESDSELDKRAIKQRIMKPEQMDEEMLSDVDSHSDDGSLFDELSSESDNFDDWFTLDVRAERAGEYLPLLGPRAFDLLTQEKRLVSARLHSLRQSIASLSDNGRLQADKLRRATAALADVDDMLKAT